MAKEKVSVESLVNEALRKLATADGPMRLSGKGDPPALFAGASGANKEAIAQLQDSANPLIRAAGTGRTATAELTALGLFRVLLSMGTGAVDAGVRFRRRLSPAEQGSFTQEIVRRTSEPGGELFSELVAAVAQDDEHAAVELANRKRRAEAAMYSGLLAAKRAQCARLEFELSTARDDEARLAALTEERAVAVPPSKSSRGESAAPIAPVPQATTPEEKDFRRNVARRLVSAWRETINLNKPEARQFMEVAIGNIDGLDQIEDEGQRVAFDGTFHRSDSAVSTGAEVTVVRPGWKLSEDGGHYIIDKAVVKP